MRATVNLEPGAGDQPRSTSSRELATSHGLPLAQVIRVRLQVRRDGWTCPVDDVPCTICGELVTVGWTTVGSIAHHAWCRPAQPTPGASMRSIARTLGRSESSVRSRRTKRRLEGRLDREPRLGSTLLSPLVVHSTPARYSKTGCLASNMPERCDTRGDDGAGCSRCHHGDGGDERDNPRRISYASTAYRTRVSLRRCWRSRRGRGPRPACHHAERRFSRSVCQSHGIAGGLTYRLSVGVAKSRSCVYACRSRHPDGFSRRADRTHGMCNPCTVIGQDTWRTPDTRGRPDNAEGPRCSRPRHRRAGLAASIRMSTGTG